jgi:hypothetical protein
MVKQILMVDDNITMLRQIGARLGSCYEVSLAKSGALAFEERQNTGGKEDD